MDELIDKVKGKMKIKQAVGAATGDEKLEGEGKVERIECDVTTCRRSKMPGMKRFARVLASVTSLALLCSCARILHPERVGNKGGAIDTIPLVVDILLFLPGIIPGVIALVVDFGTGAIYIGGSKPTTLSRVGRHGEIAIKARELPRDSVVHLRLVDAEGRVLDEDSVDSRGAKPRQRLAVDLAAAAEVHPEAGPVALALQIQVDDGPVATYAMQMH